MATDAPKTPGRVCLLGTGLMGAPMARNLARAGFEVSVWNRTAARAAPLREAGIAVAASPAAAAQGAECLVTMLADADSTESALAEGVLEQLRPGSAWAQMATVGCAGIVRLASRAAAAGVTLVDAPVLGSVKPASEGALTVLASGPRSGREQLTPLFDAVGSRTIWLGPKVGAASGLKLVLNHWILCLLENLAETLALAETLGVEADDFLGAIEGGLIDAPYAHFRTGPIIDRSFEPPLFRLAMARKDVDLIISSVEEEGAELPLIHAVARQFDRAIALGHGEADASATFLAAAPPRSRDA
jgi:3-hydroxyisobutyrate dehydrogenase